MSEVEVVRAAAADWQDVKLTRLRALADAPYAFASTLAREQAYDDEEWRRRVADRAWFLARIRGRCVGIAATKSEQDQPREQQLVAMWVEGDHRGAGAAERLVEAVLASCRGVGAETVGLWVADGNVRARRFYERVGFRPTGRRQPLPSSREVSEEQMRLVLTSPQGPLSRP
jgi:GNAT superfamily N-acetyltransferase